VRRYVETFFRHKLLLCLPVVLVLLISIWFVTSATSSYYATTTLWFDTPVPAPSSIDTSAQFTTPAALGQSVLQELATTREFLTNVGNHGPLAKYLATHHATKHGPSAELSKLLNKLKGSSAAPAPIDSQVLASLTGSITSAVIGPQILRVNLKGPDPTVVVGTLNAVVAELTDEVTSQTQLRDTATVNYYKTRLDDASTALTAAKTAETTYLQSHPSQALNPAIDPTLDQLIAAVSAADAQYTSVQSSYTDASQAAATDLTASSSFHVIDPPFPLGGKSSKKKEILAVAAGLFMGVFISVLVLIGLTAADTMARRGEDFENTEGLEVVATIQQLPAIRALSRRAKSS
jgi:uncharacterized protein involved in exopolysaccharide biosynthesis